jgi:FAD/FMN-containing dehydrogenase
VPSTFRSATLGGLYGGGFGGVGSINYGPLASTGNVLGVRAMSIEPEPQVVELRAPEALLLHHVYGTNGLVLELEVALAPALPWLEAIVCFDSFDAALEFADALASAPGIVKKSVTLLAAPIPDLLLAATPLLKDTMRAGSHAVFVLVAEFARSRAAQLVAEFGGTRDAPQDRGRGQGQQPHHRRIHLEPHHAARDEGRQGPDLHPERLRRPAARAAGQGLRQLLGDEVLVHLEFIRTKEGAMNCRACSWCATAATNG